MKIKKTLYENDFLVLNEEEDSLDGFHVLMGTYIQIITLVSFIMVIAWTIAMK